MGRWSSEMSRSVTPSHTPAVHSTQSDQQQETIQSLYRASCLALLGHSCCCLSACNSCNSSSCQNQIFCFHHVVLCCEARSISGESCLKRGYINSYNAITTVVSNCDLSVQNQS